MIPKALSGQNIPRHFAGAAALLGGKGDQRLSGFLSIEMERGHEPARRQVELTGLRMVPSVARPRQDRFDRGVEHWRVLRFE